MALKYVRRADPIGMGARMAVGALGAFGKLYQDGPINQAFVADTNLHPKNEGLFVDWSGSRIGLCRNGLITWVAGVFGATGYRDGPGNQALFAIGSSGYPVNNLVMTSPSVGYMTDGYNGAIRKLEEQPDGNWNVSTFYRGTITSMALDSLGNLWFQDGANLVRMAPDGTKSTVPASRQRVDKGSMLIFSMCADKVGNVYFHDNINAASVFYKCGQDMVIHHLCGIDQAGMNLIINSGLPVPMDGDADHCSFAHDNVVMASNDGTELYMGGGDENFIRRFKDGQSMTLGSDGYWHSFPFHVDIGYLFNWFPVGWDNEATKSMFISLGTGYAASAETWLALKSIDLVESQDAPFQVLSAEFTDWKNVVLPSKMVAGQTYNFTVAFANGCDMAWTKDSGWVCVATDGNPFGVPDHFLDEGESVLPGQIRRWTFAVTPNVAPGKYLSRFAMAYNQHAYGMSPGDFQIFATQADLDASNQSSGGAMDSQFVSQSIPTAMVTGQSYPVSVVYKNTGTETWTAAAKWNVGIRLPTWDGHEFGPNRLYLDPAASIAPGDSGTFSGTLTGPAKGTYQNQWGCVFEGPGGNWFGPLTPAVTITVTDTVTPPPPPPPTETRSVKIDWTTQDQMRTDFANFGKFRLSVGSLTPVMISDLTVRTYTMADIPVGTYNVELALVSLDGATVAGTITGVLTVTSAVTPPPPPPPEQGVPVPATLSFTLL